MKNISNLQLEFLRRQVCVLIWPATSFAQMYQQKILVANAAGQGATTVDSSLVDPWGIARSTTSPWWVSDRATGVSTVYNAAGGKLLQVTIPNGSPTGVVFNGSTTDFLVTPGGTFAHFIFVSSTGTISAWNSGAAAVVEVPGSPNSVLTGVTIAQIGDDRFLYAADLKQGKIEVFDMNFNPSVSTLSMMGMISTHSTMIVSRKGSHRSMCKTSGTTSTSLTHNRIRQRTCEFRRRTRLCGCLQPARTSFNAPGAWRLVHCPVWFGPGSNRLWELQSQAHSRPVREWPNACV